MQRLRNTGFSGRQINALAVLIHGGYSYEELVKYFNTTMLVDDIKSFTDRLSKKIGA